MDAAVVDAAVTVDAPTCPSSYTTALVGQARYRLVSSAASWTNAQADCSDDGTGTHLVIPSSSAEHDAIADAITGSTSLWIGVSDRVTENTFVVVTGGTTYHVDWFTGASSSEPDNSGDCVEQVSSTTSAVGDRGKQFDENCGSSRRYLCECDGLASDPTAY
jgi:hypothetical protein